MPAPNEALPAFVRWQQEAEKHWRAGDYAWLAERVGGRRVLEIGCGSGYGTLALAQRGIALMVLEPLADCLAIAQARLRDAGLAPGGRAPIFLQVDAAAADPAIRQQMAAFAPDWVICWLMGAEDSALDPALPRPQAVQKHREAVHRQVAELATALPSVQAVQFADRTAFPWKIKDTARETMALYHRATSFAGLPFEPSPADAFYRRLDERQWPAPAGRNAPAGVVPVLGSLAARRTTADN